MNYTIKNIPLTERPRERLKELGVKSLSDSELLSIILKNGTKDKNVKDLALELLNNYSLKDLSTITIHDLIKIKGIGEVKAMEIVVSIELGKRVFLKEDKKLIRLDNPKKIWESAKYLFRDLTQENFYAYYFNSKQELIHTKLLFVGSLNTIYLHPREIFKEAYLVSASSIVCLHNHPSNDSTPSLEDIEFTKKIKETGLIQGIPVLDHIIVCKNTYYSFYERGKL